MARRSTDPELNVFGKSPLGGNSSDDGTIEGVPLVWDERVKAYISEQAVEELNDRDISLARRAEEEREQAFLQKIGYRKG